MEESEFLDILRKNYPRYCFTLPMLGPKAARAAFFGDTAGVENPAENWIHVDLARKDGFVTIKDIIPDFPLDHFRWVEFAYATRPYEQHSLLTLSGYKIEQPSVDVWKKVFPPNGAQHEAKLFYSGIGNLDGTHVDRAKDVKRWFPSVDIASCIQSMEIIESHLRTAVPMYFSGPPDELRKALKPS